jgi:arginyl-tRNA synthetase
MTIKQRIQTDLERGIEKAGFDVGTDIGITWTSDEQFGDYTTSWALQSGKMLGEIPMRMAARVVAILGDSEIYEKPELVEPGFINFRLRNSFLGNHLRLVLAEDQKFGSSSQYKGKKAILEFSSPNVAKPLTIGHLRNINIGQSLQRMLPFLGYQTISEDHIGDWGTQFGKLMWAYKMWGQQIDNPTVNDLFSLYVRFHDEAKSKPFMEVEARQEFLKLEQGDKKNRLLWKKLVDVGMVEFERLYREFGIKFEVTRGESFYEKYLAAIVEEALKSGVAKKDSDGSVVIPLGDRTPFLILKSDGATLYNTRDLATVQYRLQTMSPDVIIYVVGAEQSFYMKQLFEAVTKLGWLRGVVLVHVDYGLTRLGSGKMSSRSGNVITAEELLTTAKECSRKVYEEKNPGKTANPKLVRDIAMGAIKWNDLKVTRSSEVVFDWDRVFSAEGNTGPYIQYSYARTQSLLKKSSKQEWLSFDYSSLDQDKEHTILRTLVKFPELVEESVRTYAPHLICTYAFSLAQDFSRFYESVQVLSSEESKKKARLALVAAVGITLRNCLYLLGIPSPERL